MKIDPQISGLPGNPPEYAHAMQLFYDERDRQKEQEQWTYEHDDGHTQGELWKAAYFYTSIALKPIVWGYTFFQSKWPWDAQWFKPWKKKLDGTYTTEIDVERCLIKAGALILAEQDRLDRALDKVAYKLVEIQKQKDGHVP